MASSKQAITKCKENQNDDFPLQTKKHRETFAKAEDKQHRDRASKRI